MNELEIKKVPFMGTDLMAAKDTSGQIWAGISYICNGIGLTKHQKDRQVATVQTDEVLQEGCLKFEAGVFDANNETVALKLDFVPLWLAKISITPAMKEERPELAESLKQYQLRAKDVLAAAFLPPKRGGKSNPPKLPPLSSVNMAMKLQADAARAAGVAPEYIQAALSKAYDPYGIAISSDHLPESEKLYECEAMARRLGIFSESGKPHKKAVSAIIGMVGTMEGEAKTVPFTLNGYSNATTKYTASVVGRVRNWLDAHGYPAVITGADGKNYRVHYQAQSA